MSGMERRGGKTLEGIVVSDKMDKTRVVEIAWKRRHPLYEKVIVGKTTLRVHDEMNKAKAGDRVLIEETRPLSRLKRWRLVEIRESRP